MSGEAYYSTESFLTPYVRIDFGGAEERIDGVTIVLPLGMQRYYGVIKGRPLYNKYRAYSNAVIYLPSS